MECIDRFSEGAYGTDSPTLLLDPIACNGPVRRKRQMPSVLNFYMDDSGTRAPNRKLLAYVPGVHDCFALGGVLVREEEEARVRAAHEEFCHRWSIEYPLHSVEIRHRSHKFSWLKRDEVSTKFMRDLTRMPTSVDVLGIACVVDRPGYDARYRERYGRRQWHLCQTAF